MLFFAGFAVGTFGAGLISDRYGRKSAIILMAQLLFGCGILTATTSNVVAFSIMWFLTGIDIKMCILFKPNDDGYLHKKKNSSQLLNN